MRRLFILVSCWLVGGGVAAAQTAPAPYPDSVYLLLGEKTHSFELADDLFEPFAKQYAVVGDRRFALSHEQLLNPSPLITIETEWHQKVSVIALERSLVELGLGIAPEAQSVVLTEEEDGTVSFSGVPREFYNIDVEGLAQTLTRLQGIKGTPLVRVVATKEYTPIEIPEALQARGITDVLGVGVSDFRGSSGARVTNIQAAGRRMQGTIVPQDETFSFNETLVDVSPEFGFVKEKVIFNGSLEYQYGGGVCQVSTTVYRSALNAGLDIPLRYAHSWVIPYYGTPGLDATIYLGSKDLKFTNDTPGDILLQYAMEGTVLTFVVYGTPDGRTVEINGPEFYNYRGIPSAERVLTDGLSPGQEVFKEGGIKGMDARWTRTLTKPGQEPVVEEIISRYKSKAPKILVGPELPKPPAPVVEEVVEVATPPAPVAPPAPMYPTLY